MFVVPETSLSDSCCGIIVSRFSFVVLRQFSAAELNCLVDGNGVVGSRTCSFQVFVCHVAGVALSFGQIRLGLSIYTLLLRNGQEYTVIFSNHQGIWKKEQQKACLW